MTKRMILMLVVATLLIAALGYFKLHQVQAAAKTGAFQPPPEAVTTIVAKEETWPSTLSVVGSTVAVHGVTVSADLPGTVDTITFDSGRFVHEGDVLLRLDTRQERAQLAALEAQRDLAKLNYARIQELANEGVVSRQDYDKSTAEQKQTEANVAEINATIQRKTIRAPFSGVLGIRQVNLGQYLSPGTAIVSLQALNPIYANFSVPQQVMGQMRPGQSVKVSTDDAGRHQFSGTGRVNALDSTVDESTRNVQVQATLANPENKLRPGMFVQVEIRVGSRQSVFPLPSSAISYAPFGDSVYIVTDLKGPDGKIYRGARQQFVKIAGSRGDQAGVVSGVKQGDEVVTSGAFKLRNGAAVAVNNQIQPGNDPSPKPEDN